MNELATAIVAFTLGVLLTIWAAAGLWKIVWRHASHCAICKQRFIAMNCRSTRITALRASGKSLRGGAEQCPRYVS